MVRDRKKLKKKKEGENWKISASMCIIISDSTMSILNITRKEKRRFG